MNTITAEHGIITEAGAIRFERLLPGPIERVWEYLVDSDDAPRPGWREGRWNCGPAAPCEMTWYNSELAGPDEVTPEKHRRG